MSNQRSPIVSFIIPVYNSEKYLQECVDSILKSDCTDIEVILVNDGSTDVSKNICDTYAASHSFIHAIHQQNQGVAMARNVGLQNASGEYVFFVDNDDWIDGEKITNLIRIITDEHPDVIVHRYAIVEEGRTSIGNGFIDTAPHDSWQTADFLDYMVRNRINILAPWEYVVRRDCILRNNISFNPHQSGVDDSVFTPLLFSASQSFSINHDMLYFWRHRADSQGKSHTPQAYTLKLLSTIKTLDAHRMLLTEPQRIDYIYYSIYKNLFSLFGPYWTLSRENKLILKNFLLRNKKLIRESAQRSGMVHTMINRLCGNLLGLIISYTLARLKSGLIISTSRIQ